MIKEQGNVIELGRARIQGHQAVAPFEWNEIEGTNLKRLRIAEQMGPGLMQARSEINRVDHGLSQLSGELDRARAELRAQGEAQYQSPHGSPYYLGMLVLLVLLEIPVNAAALDFLRLPEWESYMLAGFLGLINLIAARGSARILRQSGKGAWRDWILFGATNLALLCALYSVGQLRGALIVSQGASIPDIGIGIGTTFFLLQVLFYLGAGLLSFLQTPPVASVEQLTKRLAKLRHRLDAQWRIRATLAARYNATLEKARRGIEALERDCLQRIAQYRDGNMASRAKPTPTFMTVPVTTGAFVPIVLGQQIDEHPAPIGAVLDSDS